MNGVLLDLKLEIDEDMVLRGQGADPAVIRARRPALLDTARQALELGASLLQPQAVFQKLAVTKLRHDRLELEDGHVLRNGLLVKELRAAQAVVALVCTIGDQLEHKVTELYADQPSLSLAMDGLGTAAVEALAIAACRYFDEQAGLQGWKTTVPFSPGMIEWPLSDGQPVLFGLLKPDPSIVILQPSGQMLPRKTTSMLIGMGADVTVEGSTCDYCSMRQTCRYRSTQPH